MLVVADAVALSVSFFPPRRIAAALRAWYPRRVSVAGVGAAGPTEGDVDDGPGLSLVFEYLAGVADGSVALARARHQGDLALKAAAASGLEAVCWSSDAYPALLAAIPDPPPLLWVAGRLDVLARPLVAIVGSRGASPYGLDCAGRLAGALVTRGYGIVSGLARGVDAAAHRGALKAGGVTVAILGSGADVIYPPEHGALARDIRVAGAVVSELPPGTPPQPFHFPRRNRIISGLVSGVIVIEASERSGSLITAHAALEQGREVMAVPGNVLNGRNRGGNGLIKDGAALIEDVNDVMAALGQWAAITPRLAEPAVADDDPLTQVMVEGEPYDLDQLAAQSGLAAAALLSRLLALELAGVIGREGGGRFVRFPRSC
jgi:DNA processing protein